MKMTEFLMVKFWRIFLSVRDKQIIYTHVLSDAVIPLDA